MDALSIAAKEIAETKALIESLIISSETFDYYQARSVLKELNKKIKHLAKVQSQLHGRPKTLPKVSVPPNVHVLNFSGGRVDPGPQL